MTRTSTRPRRGHDVSAASFVYDRLRRLIVSGRFAGGTLLVEQDVASALKVSRTPVHDALRRLGTEGLVVVEPRRRARVSRISLRDIEQLYVIRMHLECISVEDAAKNLTPARLSRLMADASEMEDIAEHLHADRLTGFSDANARFHQEILRAARNDWLDRALRPVLDVLLGPVNPLAAGPHSDARDVRIELLQRSLQRTCRQHRAIIDALQTGSPEESAAAMRFHVGFAQRVWGEVAERQDRMEALVGIEESKNQARMSGRP